MLGVPRIVRLAGLPKMRDIRRGFSGKINCRILTYEEIVRELHAYSDNSPYGAYFPEDYEKNLKRALTLPARQVKYKINIITVDE